MRPRIGEKPPEHDTQERRAVARRFRAFADEHPGITPFIWATTARAWRDDLKVVQLLENRRKKRFEIEGALAHAELYADEGIRPVRYDYSHLRSLPLPERVRQAVYWLAALADEESAAPFIPSSRYIDPSLDWDDRLRHLVASGGKFAIWMRYRKDDAKKMKSQEAEELFRLTEKHLDTAWLKQLVHVRSHVASDPAAFTEAARWVDRAWAGRSPRQRLASLCTYCMSPDSPEHAEALELAGAPGAELRPQLMLLAVSLVTDPDAADYLGSITNLAKLPFGISPERDPFVPARHLLAGRQLVCEEIWDGAQPWGQYFHHQHVNPIADANPKAKAAAETPAATSGEDGVLRRPATWFKIATEGGLYPGLLKTAVHEERLMTSVRVGARWQHSVDEVCKVYPAWAPRIRAALEAENPRKQA